MAVCAGDEPADLTPILTPIREKFQAPGVAAAAIRDGRLIALGASGVRDLHSQEPVALADRSLIGSCGKAATRLLVGRLVDKKLLRWDSSLAELFPDMAMRDEYKTVTIGDIIGHRGGIQPYTMISPQRTPILFEVSGSPRENRAAFIAHLLSEEPAAPPKTKFVYSNAGYGLLGHIAERVTDKSYEKLMRDEVFGPLGMTSATVGMPAAVAKFHGWVGHERTPDGFKPVPARHGLPGIAPAGMMSCSIEDFAKLGAALVDVESGKPTEFLGSAAIEKLPELRPGGPGEGQVFFGGDGHYTAAFALWPSKGLAIVVQSNAGNSDDLCEAIVKAVRTAVAPEIANDDMIQAGSPQQRGRYGFQIKAEGDEDTWTVGLVEAGSIAEKAGVKEGDRIIAVNDKALSEIPVDDRLAALKQSPVTIRFERAGKPIEFTMRLP